MHSIIVLQIFKKDSDKNLSLNCICFIEMIDGL